MTRKPAFQTFDIDGRKGWTLDVLAVRIVYDPHPAYLDPQKWEFWKGEGLFGGVSLNTPRAIWSVFVRESNSWSRDAGEF